MISRINPGQTWLDCAPGQRHPDVRHFVNFDDVRMSIRMRPDSLIAPVEAIVTVGAGGAFPEPEHFVDVLDVLSRNELRLVNYIHRVDRDGTHQVLLSCFPAGDVH